MSIAAITGLAVEARIARRAGFAAAVSGADAARAKGVARRLLEEGAAALMSFGVAGALAPGLAPGALLLPSRVIDPAGAEFLPDPAWRDAARAALAARGLGVIEDPLAGAAHIVAAPAEKAALHRRTGAAGVDLESTAAAAAARRAGRPFLVLRAVADPADFALPAAALAAVDAAGRTLVLPVLLAALRRPGQVPDLVRLARFTRRALDALARAAAALQGLSLPPERR
ncbi:MAG TPA: hopanoid-associated phosphorylase [Stellaceae bacterium]|nr:hopanoid-associated phosphorylase [Stellaceae bacterium]